MKSTIKFVATIASGLIASTGSAFAAGQPLPEPGSLALVGLAIGALVFITQVAD